MIIPRRLVRTVPEHTSDEVEAWWDQAVALHPGWRSVTWRDPIIEKEFFPLTSPHWDKCESGAQLADLVRAEDLYRHGGIYIDSDYEVFRSFEPLLSLRGFAGWEDENVICNAAMGFCDFHPALRAYIEIALKRLDQGTWQSGVGTITEVFRDRTDLLLLPPQALYPVHYRHKEMIPFWLEDVRGQEQPWVFGLHHWKHSWQGGA